MTRARWRTMACLLAVGLGGLVVWADDPPSAPKPMKPADPPKTYERESPAVHAPPPVEGPGAQGFIINGFTIPTPTSVVVPETLFQVATPTPVFAPPAPSPEPPPPPPIIRITPPLPAVVAPPCSERPCFDKPEIVRAEPDPPTRFLTPPPTPPAMPGRTVPYVEVARTVPQPAAPVMPAPISFSRFPWKIGLEFVNGLTQVELRRGDELLLRVQCEKLDLSTPSAGLHAVGKVVVSGPCLEARCETISIAWNSGQVALDGSVYLSFQNKGVVQVMRAESLCFQLTGSNVPVEFTAREVQQIAMPR